MKKNNVTISILFLFITEILSQAQSKEHFTNSVLNEMDIDNFSSDMFFWNGEYFYCSKSPFAYYKNYKRLLNEDGILRCSVDRAGSPINDTKQYYAVWFIRDSMLYLCNVFHECLDDSIFPNQYNDLEKITSQTFNHMIDSIPSIQRRTDKYDESIITTVSCVVCRNGTIPTTWLSGYLFLKAELFYLQDFNTDSIQSFKVKEKYNLYQGSDFEDWTTTPFIRLKFHKGKIIETTEVMYKPSKK